MRYITIVAAATLALVQGESSHATVYDWAYTGVDVGVSGHGTLIGAPLSQVTSISGTANGYSIVGLSGYDEPDQIIFPNYPSLDPVVTNLGISFSVGDGSESFNISLNAGYCGVAYDYCLVGLDDTNNVFGPPTPGTPIYGLTSFTITPAPEPSTWAMMLLGFAGFGYAGYRRARAA